jgi:peptidoglycan L-alanyl-D-glutamate endopeptidase CwlK
MGKINMPKFSKASLEQRETLHDKLKAICDKAIKITDFKIVEGSRSEEKQNQLFEQGYSKVKFPNSKHNKTPSLAMDLLPYPFEGWNNKEQFYELAGVIKAVAYDYGVKIKWGGDFKSFFDGMHFEIEEN